MCPSVDLFQELAFLRGRCNTGVSVYSLRTAVNMGVFPVFFLNVYAYYKVLLRDVAKGVPQQRNENNPAWNEYHKAGNSRIRIVLT